jgi:adenylate cyclase
MAAIAAPILSVEGEVVGALYGERRRSTTAGFLPRIDRLEAMLIELLASGVAAGLARQAHQSAALAAEVRFQQFFTPELARHLAARPDLLAGQESEITVLFADIRHFSRLSDKLGPGKTVKWINHVMEALSDCVHEQAGVLVDYIGDELMAMWGAPESQTDHAARAVRAALGMFDVLPELNEQWSIELGEPMDLGIGINSGVAQVGNMGSARKFKYGPLGGMVNLASRIQGLNKYLRSRLLVSKETWSRLGPERVGRRIGFVRVVNIEAPVELYELATKGTPRFAEIGQGYEAALALFERREFRQATRTLGALLPDFPDDGPSLVLLSRVVNAMVDPERFDVVFVPPGK